MDEQALQKEARRFGAKPRGYNLDGTYNFYYYKMSERNVDRMAEKMELSGLSVRRIDFGIGRRKTFKVAPKGTRPKLIWTA